MEFLSSPTLIPTEGGEGSEEDGEEKCLKETGRKRSWMFPFSSCYGYLYNEYGGPGGQSMPKGG